MSTMILGYTAVMWSIIILLPNALIGIFSSDAALMQDAVPALNNILLHLSAWIFNILDRPYSSR